MSLLELLHNEKVVKTLEKINYSLQEIKEPNADLAHFWPSIILMLEMFLKKHKVSDISDVIMKKRKKEILKSDIEQLEYKISEIKYKIDIINSDINEIDSFTDGAYQTKKEVEKLIIDTLSEQLIKNKKLNYGEI